MNAKKDPPIPSSVLVLTNRMFSGLPSISTEKRSVYKSINMTSNYISSLPSDMKHLDALTTLVLARNQFSSIPPQLINHPSLDHLVSF
jgi:Leucine-rich repeat (LRR) protein